MNKIEKIRLIEEIMELEEDTLNEDSVLSNYDEWDSLTIISYIVLMDTQFDKNISINEIKRFITVKDAINLM